MANTSLTIDDNGRKLIEAFEGLFLKTYDDGEGVLTLGFGHTTAAGPPKVVPGMTCTAIMADQMLSADLKPVEATVKRLITAELSQNEFNALGSFEFNTGDLAKSSIPSKINAGNKQAAMDTLMQYVHGRNSGKAYNGLLRRRKAERLMFLGDVKGALTIAGNTNISDAVPKSAPPPTPVPPKPSVTSPAKGSIGAAIKGLFNFLFTRK